MRITDEHRNLDDIMQELVKAIDKDDKEKYKQLYQESIQVAKAEVTEQLRQEQEAAAQGLDQTVLRQRGSNVLTSVEKKFYEGWIQAMKAEDAKQGISNLKEGMPETIIERVTEDMRKKFPLLDAIDFTFTGAVTKIVRNKAGEEEAVWGDLCDEIVKELSAGFEVVEADLYKLSAFLPVCEQGITFGPNWLDAYVRARLSNSAGNGLVRGLVDGTGKKEPIGMTRQVGETAVVTGGVYPRKNAVKVQKMDMETVGALLAMLAMDENGNERSVENVILVVNQVDYLRKVLPATRIQTPDGEWRSTLPYPMTIIPVTRGLEQGKAVLGLGKRYGAYIGKGTSKKGNIDYSDEFRWLQDQRVYRLKLFGNGAPDDNNAFLLLDISELLPARFTVHTVEAAPSDNTDLASLTLGSAALDPTFDPDTDAYAATTENATNVIRAVPADADAEIAITLNGDVVPNDSALNWEAGENTVVVTVTAPNGSTKGTYTITVTKS